MKEKQVVLQNLGMERDISVSKIVEGSVFENRNIRIMARDNDTMLSVTNERGTKEIPLPAIKGQIIGWNVLNNHIILFSREEEKRSLSLLAMASELSVYGEDLQINEVSDQSISFKLVIVNNKNVSPVTNIVCYFMPSADYKEGEPIMDGQFVRKMLVGSTTNDHETFDVRLTGIDGNRFYSDYIVVVEYDVGGMHYDHVLDIDVNVDSPEVDPSYTIQRITLSSSTIDMDEGTYYNQLKCTGYFQSSVGGTRVLEITPIWESSDDSVASINALGEISAKTVGSCEITATYSGQTATCVVNVERVIGRVVQDGITFEVSKSQLAVGESAALTCYLVYSDGRSEDITGKASFSVTNSTILGLSGATVRGNAVGSAEVVVSYGSYSDRAKITVRNRTSGGGGTGGGESYTGKDYIYRIDYVDGNFRMVRGRYPSDNPNDYEFDVPLFEGNLGFDCNNPIESIVSEESENIQKIYWIDGKNVLRFVNFNEACTVVGGKKTLPWDTDAKYFDSNKPLKFTLSVDITKDNAGNNRPNGVAQYLVTYYNRYGQESGSAWISDLVYLSPSLSGGAADGTNNNRVVLTISGLDTSFTNFRVYMVFRTSLDGEAVTYLVADQHTTSEPVIITDDGAHLTLQDTTRIFYLGSQPVVAGTMTHKDNTLFLGDLQSVGKSDYTELENTIKNTMFAANRFESTAIEFVYSNHPANGTAGIKELSDIPYVDKDGYYPYENQLQFTSSEITSFKGGEKYRFALKFKLKNGIETEAFWIGDKENTLYPIIDVNGKVIKRVCVRCTLPAALVSFLQKSSQQYATVQLLIAEATSADRSVKAQGFINPTMFNTWERYSGRGYSIPSWISRPRNSLYPYRHFSSVAKCTSSLSELQCSYWDGTEEMHPYFQYKRNGADITYAEEFKTDTDFDYMIITYEIVYTGTGTYHAYVRIAKGKVLGTDSSNADALLAFNFTTAQFQDYRKTGKGKLNTWENYTDPSGKFVIEYATISTSGTSSVVGVPNHGEARKKLYTRVYDAMTALSIPIEFIIDYNTFATSDNSWCKKARDDKNKSITYNANYPNNGYSSYLECLNAGGVGRWKQAGDVSLSSSSGNKFPAYQKKHLMFVDENIVTLNSPEISYGTAFFDNADYKFRIVGAVKMSSVISDYLIETENTPPANKVFDQENFSATKENKDTNISGILAWPVLKDYGLYLKENDNSDPVEKLTPANYKQSNNIIRYWIYMWHHSGSISEYSPEEETDTLQTTQPVLSEKIFANLRFAYSTIFFNNSKELSVDSIRISQELGSQAYNINIGTESDLYIPRPQLFITMPGSQKYPLVYSTIRPMDTTSSEGIESESAYLYSDSPVMLEFTSDSHAVISLHSDYTPGVSLRQSILPRLFDFEAVDIPAASGNLTAATVPWFGDDIKNIESYSVEQYNWTSFAKNDMRADGLMDNDQYLFVGEIYTDFSNGADTRYGGTSESAVAGNRFIIAGPAYNLADMFADGLDCIYGNQGDTYFQRWDCVKTKPFASGAVNKVIDITSVMLETHINLDGRTDLQRGITEIASLDLPQFGTMNRVYSQKNNLSVARDLDSDFNDDSFRSSITWTLPKADGADIDEWTRITLGASLKLDSDKGICRALRRMQNSIISFQDRGISEILFNSRTQLSTQDGVPIEIANSGKVDGKRYITAKYGCLNKWSIVEGKSALYFVDNINKAFCTFNGNVENLSEKLGFSMWFHENNDINPWNPVRFNNIVSFYDRIHSDVYLITSGGKGSQYPSIVYNEKLGKFTSFFDYANLTFIANVEDRLVSGYDSRLWLQNEGAYGNFFGKTYPFSVQYRVVPNPYSDKIWTNIEYRADFYKVLDQSFNSLTNLEEDFTGDTDMYQPNETFDYMRFWNEYQTTPKEGDVSYNIKPEKKFRIWRVVIPRAVKTETNKFGLDRIRNPWINLILKKNVVNSQNLMQLHDVIVKYFE